MNVVVRTRIAPDAQAVSDLERVGVATAHEAMGRLGLMSPEMRPIYSGARIAGRAVTVLCQAGDNLMIHAAVEQCVPGDIMVVATMSPSTDGMFGDLLATALKARGALGLVIGAGVRDVADLTEMEFPVWSLAVSAQGTVKATPGSVNVPIVVAGQTIRPGDVIVADDDGVMVVPRQSAKDVAVAAMAREQNEAVKREQLREGILSLDLYGMRELLANLGVEYVDDDSVE
jgi:4-hydroxy-4-methyl-2-oxoglutarate aldolase